MIEKTFDFCRVTWVVWIQFSFRNEILNKVIIIFVAKFESFFPRFVNECLGLNTVWKIDFQWIVSTISLLCFYVCYSLVIFCCWSECEIFVGCIRAIRIICMVMRNLCMELNLFLLLKFLLQSCGEVPLFLPVFLHIFLHYNPANDTPRRYQQNLEGYNLNVCNFQGWTKLSYSINKLRSFFGS